MNPKLYKICNLGNGQLFMMPKPRAESLEKDIQYYQSKGITKVVSLLLPEEIETLQMTQEEMFCQTNGLDFINFSIKDMDVPDLDELRKLNQSLKQDLENGEAIAIHCHGGRGRAGTVAITLMQEFGYSAVEAMQIAQTGRQDQNVPVCDIQKEFVKNYKYER